MGVYLTIRSTTVDQIAALDAKPELLPAFFDAAAFEDLLPRPTFWQLLTGRGPSVPESLLDQSNCMEVGLEKAWHALHFLFTNTADGGDPPACYLMSGGLGLSSGDTDAHALSPQQVEEFRSFRPQHSGRGASGPVRPEAHDAVAHRSGDHLGTRWRRGARLRARVSPATLGLSQGCCGRRAGLRDLDRLNRPPTRPRQPAATASRARWMLRSLVCGCRG